MKPSFALNLSHDGISLLHRAQSGWLNVGDVSLDARDLMDELVVLRRTAADLEAGGLTTKLVIPDSQILYVEVDAPGPSRADRVAQIRDALVGLTPYDLSDLVFDWRAKGKKAKVAVVARETLTEAEAFATQYRFNPVSFVATPKNGAFDGEPFFGPTRHAVRVLEGGETIEPDKRRIKVVGKLGDMPSVPKAAANDAGTRSEPQPDAVADEAVAPDESNAAPDAATEVARTDKSPGTAATDPATFKRDWGGAEAAAPEPAPIAFSSRRPAAAEVNRSAIPDTGKPRPAPRPASDADDAAQRRRSGARVADLPPIPPRDTPKAGDLPRVSAPAVAQSRLNGAAVPPLVDRSTSSPAAKPVGSAPVTAEKPAAADAAPAPKPGRRFSFLGRLGKSGATAEPAPKLSETLERMRTGPLPGETAGARPGAAKAPAIQGPAEDAPAPPREIPSRRAKDTGPSRQLARRAPPPPAPKLKPLPKVQISARASLPEGRVAPGPTDAPIRPEGPRPVTATEADAMTVFGARGKAPPPARTRSIGPAATVAGLLILAVAGLWSTFYLGDFARDWLGLGGEPEVAEVVEPAPVILPETPAGGVVTDGPIAGIPGSDTATADPDAIADVPQPVAPDATVETAAGPDEESVVPPSVPMPGIEVTDLQPEPDQVAPSAPGLPAEDVATAVPGAETALPSLLAETDATPPALVAVTPPPADSAPDLVIAAAEPPAAPELPPVVDVSPPVVDTSPPDPEAAVPAPEPFDPGPGSDIATVAPRPPSGTPDTSVEPGAPTADDTPSTLDIVRLDPPDAEVSPDAETSAPPPTVTARVAAPTPEEAAAIYERTGVAVLAPPIIDSPGVDRLSDVVLSSVDVSLAQPRSRELPTAEELDASTDPLPRATLPPFPLTLDFDLDDRGLVRATEEGALTPQGVLVIRGRPSVVPPPRPTDAEPEEESRAVEEPSVLGEPESADDGTRVAEAPAEETGTVEDEFALVDPSVFRDVPLLDDTDLAEVEERARYGGRTREELAGIRPTLRPETDLAAAEVPADPDTVAEVPPVNADDTPDVAQSNGDDATLTLASLPRNPGGAGTVEAGDTVPDSPLINLAAVVPPLRPGTDVPAEAPAGEVAPDGAPDTSQDVVAAAPPVFEDATDLAVEASLTPATRPAGFASIVEAALEEAARAPTPPPSPSPSTSRPAATPPVSVAVRAPEIPSSAAVASTATEENALRLNRVNLIGVYGSSANRRALVRLSSGRYVKVQVGDTVDGGRVAAIGDAELRYVKGGRTLTLALPNG